MCVVDGRLYYTSIQLPLEKSSVGSTPWDSMFHYYRYQFNNEMKGSYSTISLMSTVTDILNNAFNTSMNQITNSSTCFNCTNSKLNINTRMNVLRILSLRYLYVYVTFYN